MRMSTLYVLENRPVELFIGNHDCIYKRDCLTRESQMTDQKDEKAANDPERKVEVLASTGFEEIPSEQFKWDRKVICLFMTYITQEPRWWEEAKSWSFDLAEPSAEVTKICKDATCTAFTLEKIGV